MSNALDADAIRRDLRVALLAAEQAAASVAAETLDVADAGDAEDNAIDVTHLLPPEPGSDSAAAESAADDDAGADVVSEEAAMDTAAAPESGEAGPLEVAAEAAAESGDVNPKPVGSGHWSLRVPVERRSFDLLLALARLLSEREQEVVKLRFGIEDGRPRTLEEVGRTFGVTRERIRQIESKTLAKLRHPQRSEHLKSYLVD